MTTEATVIYLCACAVNGVTPDPARLAGADAEELLRTAGEHQLSCAAAMALEAAGIRPEAVSQTLAAAQYKAAYLDADRRKVLAALEKAGIWYMPLKGSVIKDLYPRFGMREMADNDILFDASRAEDVRGIMEGLGFTTEVYAHGADDVYYKKPVSNFEMHRCLFEDWKTEKLAAYFADVKDRLVKDEGNEYGWHFTDEDFYLYMLAHEYKHYTGKGTGLRSLLDVYVYLKNKPLDMEFVRRETEKLGLREYEETNRNLALYLFDPARFAAEGADGPAASLPEKEREMLDYILTSGTYGTVDHLVEKGVKEKGAGGYLRSRLAISRGEMEQTFPVLRKAPALLPVFRVWRLVWGPVKYHRKVRRELSLLLHGNKKSPPDGGTTESKE